MHEGCREPRLAGMLRCAWRDTRCAELCVPKPLLLLILRGRGVGSPESSCPMGRSSQHRSTGSLGAAYSSSRGVWSVVSVTSGLCSSFSFSRAFEGFQPVWGPLSACSSRQTGFRWTWVCGEGAQCPSEVGAGLL